MSEFTGETERVLRAAGWRPERRVEGGAWIDELRASGFRTHAAAARFLSEFGGLVVAVAGPGISCAREPFEFDPLLALGEDDRFNEWGQSVRRVLCPIGELDHGRFFLGIDERGEIYLVADWIALFGPVEQALEGLVLGRAPHDFENQGF